MSLTRALAMDCEMVGAGPNGKNSIAARVSLVNENGACVFDAYIMPVKKVTDYRTSVSGITPGHLARGRPFNEVKQQVAKLIRGRTLVGHSVKKDLRVLGLCHPECNVRDTALFPPFQTTKGTPGLKYLAKRYLGWTIQNGSHNSVEDAKAAMRLYKIVERDWEDGLQESDSDESECYDDWGNGWYEF